MHNIEKVTITLIVMPCTRVVSKIAKEGLKDSQSTGALGTKSIGALYSDFDARVLATLVNIGARVILDIIHKTIKNLDGSTCDDGSIPWTELRNLHFEDFAMNACVAVGMCCKIFIQVKIWSRMAPNLISSLLDTEMLKAEDNICETHFHPKLHLVFGNGSPKMKPFVAHAVVSAATATAAAAAAGAGAATATSIKTVLAKSKGTVDGLKHGGQETFSTTRSPNGILLSLLNQSLKMPAVRVEVRPEVSHRRPSIKKNKNEGHEELLHHDQRGKSKKVLNVTNIYEKTLYRF
uniref:Uncharacterized protein n=1 Tax=Glossina palpalis gambiensis TaxID=67801 RepID=A0A1B0BPZ2_9MUSC